MTEHIAVVLGVLVCGAALLGSVWAFCATLNEWERAAPERYHGVRELLKLLAFMAVVTLVISACWLLGDLP